MCTLMLCSSCLACVQVPGFMDAQGHWPRQMMTLATDGIATIIGSLLGTSPLTIFAESAVGIRAGGKTGITSFVVAFGFFCSMFLAPIFGSIPPYATGPAIIMVGALMMVGVEKKNRIEHADRCCACSSFGMPRGRSS